MPEVDFILAPDEQTSLLKYLLGQGLVFVPDVRYKEPKYATLEKIEHLHEYVESADGTRLFFVLGSRFSQHPLEMRAGTSQDGERFFYVPQRRGGPCLDLLLSTLRTQPAALLISGFSAYYRSYWIGRPEMETPAPSDLKILFKSILAWLRDHGRCVVTAKARRRYWVGSIAEDMLLHGVKSNVESLRL